MPSRLAALLPSASAKARAIRPSTSPLLMLSETSLSALRPLKCRETD